MNEPSSPEAKQAAIDWDKTRNKDVDGFPTIIEAFAEGYDTATANAREELEEARKVVARCFTWTEKGWQPIAHQQPSAITTNEQAYRDGTLSQPSVCPKCGYKSCLDLSSPSLQQPVKAQKPSEDFSKSGMSAGGIQTWREASEVEQPTAEEPEPLPAKFLREDGKGFINI